MNVWCLKFYTPGIHRDPKPDYIYRAATVNRISKSFGSTMRYCCLSSFPSQYQRCTMSQKKNCLYAKGYSC
ncbi:hypothetical protein OUZ56_013232 [Daphnia magna]|uniref:Uncharacterized protein n=1 Tax=Daphnia magna TaxID=35525 RepID=A0ABQ9Z589_9CRUS|nr:hypothetical protein OUZ56_013232 [Daphnia magna]